MRFGSDSGEKRGTTVDGLGVCARRQAGGTSLGPRSGHGGCVSFSHAKMHAQSRFLPSAHESESVRGLEVQRMLVKQCLCWAGRLMTMLDERGPCPRQKSVGHNALSSLCSSIGLTWRTLRPWLMGR
jgi:hypothetical protein